MEIDLRFQDPFFLVFEVGNGGGEDRIGKEAERKETHETPNKTKGTEGVHERFSSTESGTTVRKYRSTRSNMN